MDMGGGGNWGKWGGGNRQWGMALSMARIFLTIIEIDSFTKKEYFTSLLSRHLSSIGNGMPEGK